LAIMSTPEAPATVEQVPHGHTARRLQWAHLPPALRALVERRLGSAVEQAVSQDSGFTPGFASILTGADGSRVFVKAANKKAQKQTAEAYAEEARKLALLPPGLPLPRPLWAHQDELWVVLGFECIDGGDPKRPWVPHELDACLDALEQVADVLHEVPDGIEANPITVDLPGLVSCWPYVRKTHPDWPHLEEAIAVAQRFEEFPGNDVLVHSDARDDNFILDGAGRALLCDWNWPNLGPVWLDTVDLLVQAHGDGLDADAILAERRLTKDADPDHVDAWLAMLWGYMTEARDRPVPATSPYLRVHSRWWSEAAWSWLASRRGWS
jgi:aminoglycoside phosphotransferase (APT) family kinase protein